MFSIGDRVVVKHTIGWGYAGHLGSVTQVDTFRRLAEIELDQPRHLKVIWIDFDSLGLVPSAVSPAGQAAPPAASDPAPPQAPAHKLYCGLFDLSNKTTLDDLLARLASNV